jgi:hypothetical protein
MTKEDATSFAYAGSPISGCRFIQAQFPGFYHGTVLDMRGNMNDLS